MEPSSPKLLPDLQTLQSEAGTFAQILLPTKNHATLITLSGELGAGKTSFTQGIAKGFGIEESVTSPTFVLEKIYELIDRPFSRLVHIDAYRLDADGSLIPLGFSELYADPSNLIILEWPELIANQLPKADHHITLKVEGEGRTISYA